MRRYFTVLTALFTVVAMSSMVLASNQPQTDKTKTAPIAKKAEALVSIGKIVKFDEATKALTITTKKHGDKSFVVSADTKIMSGAKMATPAELVAGKEVKVAYTEAAGVMTATKITIEVMAAKPAVPEKK
jgi:hypothetical protein